MPRAWAISWRRPLSARAFAGDFQVAQVDHATTRLSSRVSRLERSMTFSIVARDPSTGAFGAAVATGTPVVGAMVPYAEWDSGAIVTQGLSTNEAATPEPMLNPTTMICSPAWAFCRWSKITSESENSACAVGLPLLGA